MWCGLVRWDQSHSIKNLNITIVLYCFFEFSMKLVTPFDQAKSSLSGPPWGIGEYDFFTNTQRVLYFMLRI